VPLTPLRVLPIFTIFYSNHLQRVPDKLQKTASRYLVWFKSYEMDSQTEARKEGRKEGRTDARTEHSHKEVPPLNKESLIALLNCSLTSN